MHNINNFKVHIKHSPFKSIKSIKSLSAFLMILIMVFLTLSVPFLSYATTTQNRLDETNDEIDDLKSQQTQFESDLSSLNSQVAALSNRITDMDAQIAVKEQEIQELNETIAALDLSQKEQYSAMKKRIQYMYEHNSTSFLDTLFSSASFSDMLTKVEYVRKINEYDRNMMDKLNDTYTQQTEYSATLLADQQELASIKNELVAKKNEISLIIAAMKDKIAANTEDITEAEKRAKAYEEQLEQERIAEERRRREEEAKNNNNKPPSNTIDRSPFEHTQEELAMLAAIIECEAGGESYEGKIAVGSVVLNRVRSQRWPNTILGVLYQSGQFSPVASGRFAIVLARGANTACYQAARDVLGGNITVSAIYFTYIRKVRLADLSLEITYFLINGTKET